MAAKLDPKPAINESDPRVQQIARSIKTYKKKPEALIQVLHVVQDLYGYLPAEMLRLVSREMRVPPSRVYGVVTFYHYFTLRPKGDHTCVICMGTACYVKGAERLLEGIEQAFVLRSGETTLDRKLSLQTARCLGACGLAPVVVLDNVVMAKIDAAQLIPMIRSRMEAQK